MDLVLVTQCHESVIHLPRSRSCSHCLAFLTCRQALFITRCLQRGKRQKDSSIRALLAVKLQRIESVVTSWTSTPRLPSTTSRIWSFQLTITHRSLSTNITSPTFCPWWTYKFCQRSQSSRSLIRVLKIMITVHTWACLQTLQNLEWVNNLARAAAIFHSVRTALEVASVNLSDMARETQIALVRRQLPAMWLMEAIGTPWSSQLD